jgi:hypothetical protein
MSNQSRLWPTFVGAALASFAVAGAAHAQTAGQKPAKTQLPSQVIPTGADDAPQAAALARSAAAAQPAQLEAELVQMTSTSSQGLTRVRASDGSTRVDLEGRFMSVAVATPTSDGGVEVSCHTGKQALAKVKYAREVSAGVLPKPKKPSAAAKASPVLPEEK